MHMIYVIIIHIPSIYSCPNKLKIALYLREYWLNLNMVSIHTCMQTSTKMIILMFIVKKQ